MAYTSPESLLVTILTKLLLEVSWSFAWFSTALW